MPSLNLAMRLIRRIEITPTCWNWLGNKNVAGYGRLKINRRQHKAHRLSYEIFVGHLPGEMDVHHECRNRACVNPAHLMKMDRPTHSRDFGNRLKTHCVNGHELTMENTRDKKVKSGGRPRRGCRICSRAAHAKWRKANPELVGRLKREWKRKNDGKKRTEEKGLTAEAGA